MRTFAKPLYILFAVQAICLALGLWLHGRFLIASAGWSAKTAIWQQLEEWSPQSSDFNQRLQVVDTLLEREDSTEAENIAEFGAVPEEIGLVLVDSNWRVLSYHTPNDLGRQVRWSPGQLIDWTSDPSSMNGQGVAIRGRIQTAGGTRLALAKPIEDSQGYMLTYHLSDGRLDAASLIESMPASAMVTFLWTFGLQCIVAFLMHTRVNFEHSRKQLRLQEESLQRKTDLVRTRDAVIFGLAKLAESRDPDTGHHLERISLYSTRLSSELPKHEKYRKLVTPGFIQLIGISSALHDIGKVGVEDAILLKPGKLADDERNRMSLHSEVGGECIREIEQRLGKSNFLQMAREIALYHHERWDGTGYPNGLSGEAIPLSARIVAIADVYDALSVQRVYKRAIPHEQCIEIIRNEAGKQFDPDLIEVFMKIHPQFELISKKFAVTPDTAAESRELDDHRPELDPWFMSVQDEALVAAISLEQESVLSSSPAS